MKKYRVTEKHGFFKKGNISLWANGSKISYNEDDNDFTYILDFGKTHIESWLKDGWIEEIQPPEFTKQDMKESFRAGIEWLRLYNQGEDCSHFEDWIETKNKTK